MTTATQSPARRLTRPAVLLATLALIALVTAFGPVERTLGENLRLVILHGAWVWAGKAAFGLAALAGLAALVTRRQNWAGWSLALGRTGLVFWLTYLPMSLLIMQLNWGGLFFDEPRWRVPFLFGIVAVVLQVALALLKDADLTALGNLLFGAALWWRLGGAENVLHPDSPVFGGGSATIQVFFVLLLALSLAAGAQIALWLHSSPSKG